MTYNDDSSPLQLSSICTGNAEQATEILKEDNSVIQEKSVSVLMFRTRFLPFRVAHFDWCKRKTLAIAHADSLQRKNSKKDRERV